MQLSEDSTPGEYIIRSYQPGEFIVNEKSYNKSLIVSKNKLIPSWPPQTIEELKSDHFQIISDLKPELMILGTGEKQHFPDAKILATIINNNIGLEIMNTRAACRTFNLLIAEGRNVACALIIS